MVVLVGTMGMSFLWEGESQSASATGLRTGLVGVCPFVMPEEEVRAGMAFGDCRLSATMADVVGGVVVGRFLGSRK